MKMKEIIHIYGASGSGTTTLGKKICKELDYQFMDTDDYFWVPTNPRYTTKRKKEDRLALIKKDIELAGNVVISGSLVDWGDELIPLFTMAIRLVTDTDIRILRIKEREKQKFGDRIEPGGDMYQQHIDFIEWARAYDTGDVNMRSKEKHDEWQKLLKCKQIILNGEDEIELNFQVILGLHPASNHSNGAEYFVSLQGGGGKRSGVVPPLTDDNAADGKIGSAVTMVTSWMQY